MCWLKHDWSQHATHFRQVFLFILWRDKLHRVCWVSAQNSQLKNKVSCWEPPCLVSKAVNPLRLRLSERPWERKPLRRQSLSPWQGCCLRHSLSPHSVCKKSPNLLSDLLPLPDLSLKQWQRVVQPCAGKGRFPRAIRLKKEYCETCFAKNALNSLIKVQKWNEFVS